MRKLFCILLATCFSIVSCASKPNAKNDGIVIGKKVNTKIKEDIVDSGNEVIAKFDGVEITRKDKEIAKSEIQVVVDKLNNITYQKNYYYWLKFLSNDYKREFSKPAVLKKVSQGLPGVARGIHLKDLSDYFSYVFVPSRQQGRVDDILYVSPKKVRVIKKEKGKSLIFYNLEKINGKWLLVP